MKRQLSPIKHSRNYRINHCIKVIRKDLLNIPTLFEIAEIVGISPQHLSRIFPLYTGLTFTEYCNCLKIEQSLRLIEEKSISLKKIALLSGFSSHSYFSKVFRKYVGLSPKEYMLSLLSLS